MINSHKRTRRPSRPFCIIMTVIIAAAVIIISLPTNSVEWRKIYSDLGIKPMPDGGNLIHYLNAGQADCTVFSSGNEAGLIDCGDINSGNGIANRLKSYGFDSLEFVLITHAHTDHIGGLLDLMSRIKVGALMMSDWKAENDDEADMLEAIRKSCDKRGVKIINFAKGDSFSLGEFTFDILSLNLNDENVNDRSAVIRADCGDNSFLFTGDASSKVEHKLVQSGSNIKCDVLKAGHHGSRYSSSFDFLCKTSPGLVIFSCGLDNSYSHPSAETLNRVKKAGIDYFRTDLNGTVTVDADDLTVECERGGVTTARSRASEALIRMYTRDHLRSAA